MGNMTRRTFIRGTAAIAAGAAAGLTIPRLGLANSKGIREYAPVEIRTFFLGPDPIVIQSAIYADDRRDVFGIRVFEKGEEFCRAEIGLSIVKRVVASPFKTILCGIFTRNEHGKTEKLYVDLLSEDGCLTFYLRDERNKRSDKPVWMSLTDVRRVL
jgi:hypothetical protein